jgi:hypothetical protein
MRQSTAVVVLQILQASSLFQKSCLKKNAWNTSNLPEELERLRLKWVGGAAVADTLARQNPHDPSEWDYPGIPPN